MRPLWIVGQSEQSPASGDSIDATRICCRLSEAHKIFAVPTVGSTHGSVLPPLPRLKLSKKSRTLDFAQNRFSPVRPVTRVHLLIEQAWL